MPALFERHPHAPVRRHHRRTVLLSVILHACALLALIVVQLGAAFDGLDVNRRLDFVMLPAPPPPPPVVQPPAPAATEVTVNPDAAPVVANDVVLDAPPPAPRVASGPPVPGALVTGQAGERGVAPGTGAASVALAAPPARRDPVPVGGDVLRPSRTHFVPPAYPEVARAARVDGTVILEATIDEAGEVQNVKVLRSIPLLDRAAVDAVRQWRYTPTRLNGVPVAVVMTVTVTFTLR